LAARRAVGCVRRVDGDVTVAATNMPSDAGASYAWAWTDSSSYMRDLAQRCTRAARDCPHRPTSNELEAIGVELMEKAKQLDEFNQTSDAAPRKAAPGRKVPKK
jgi:hypothetical protein